MFDLSVCLRDGRTAAAAAAAAAELDGERAAFVLLAWEEARRALYSL